MSQTQRQSTSRCISAPLQPKVIGNGMYVLSMTETSDQLFSQHSTEDFNFHECSNFLILTLKGVPDEYNEENEECDKTENKEEFEDCLVSEFSRESKDRISEFYYKQNFVDQPQTLMKKPFTYNTSLLQELYQSNDIIYEEDDLPEGFTTTNSAMSTNENKVQKVIEEQLQKMEKKYESTKQQNVKLKSKKQGTQNTERLIKKIDRLFQEKIQKDIGTFREKRKNLEMQITEKQTLLKQMVQTKSESKTQKIEQKIIKPTEQATAQDAYNKINQSKEQFSNYKKSFTTNNDITAKQIYSALGDKGKLFSKHSRSFTSTSSSSFNNSINKQYSSEFDNPTSQIKQVSHSLLKALCKNLKSDRHKNRRLFNSEVHLQTSKDLSTHSNSMSLESLSSFKPDREEKENKHSRSVQSVSIDKQSDKKMKGNFMIAPHQKLTVKKEKELNYMKQLKQIKKNIRIF